MAFFRPPQRRPVLTKIYLNFSIILCTYVYDITVQTYILYIYLCAHTHTDTHTHIYIL